MALVPFGDINGFGTTHTINLPPNSEHAHAIGDMVLIVPGVGINNVLTWPTGWTSLIAHGISAVRGEARYRILDGTEPWFGSDTPSIDVTMGSNSFTSYQGVLIPAAEHGGSIQGASAQHSAPQAPDPPALMPSWGPQLGTHFLTFDVHDLGTVTVTGVPAGYTALKAEDVNTGETGGCGVQGAYRTAEIETEDPAAFTSSAETAEITMTIAVNPPGGANVPIVGAGLDATSDVFAEFARTATEDDQGETITSREWRVISGPAYVNDVLSTAAALAWTPNFTGSYVLRYSATNADGTGTDEVTVTIDGAGIELDVFGANGQSNAVYLTTPHEDAPVLPDGRAYRFDEVSGTKFISANGDCIYPAFAQRWWELTGRRCMFVTGAVGGTAQSSECSSPNWDIAEPGEGNLYTTAKTRMDTALALATSEGWTPVNRGWLWDQGGRDSQDIDLANCVKADYKAGLEGMVAELRTDFGAGYPLWITRLGRPSTGTTPGWDDVRDAQTEVVAADADVHHDFLDTIDFADEGKHADEFHYTQLGYNEIGVGKAEYIAAELELSGALLEARPIGTGHVRAQLTVGAGVELAARPSGASHVRAALTTEKHLAARPVGVGTLRADLTVGGAVEIVAEPVGTGHVRGELTVERLLVARVSGSGHVRAVLTAGGDGPVSIPSHRVWRIPPLNRVLT